MVLFDGPQEISSEMSAAKRRRTKRKKMRKDSKESQILRQETGPPTVPTRKSLRWWERSSIQYAFCHPQIRSRLEKLMGTNYVNITERPYMIFLQQRILEDYASNMGKRITVRQAEEMERVKNLVLTGKIPLDQAPPEMANHPVMLIDQHCRKLIAERRAKIKVLKPNIPKHLYWDDTPDPPSGLSIESGHVFRQDNARMCVPPDGFLAVDDAKNINDGYMFTDEEFEMIKYESPLVKQLKDSETVDAMYQLADEIIGVLKTLEERDEIVSQTSTITANLLK